MANLYILIVLVISCYISQNGCVSSLPKNDVGHVMDIEERFSKLESDTAKLSSDNAKLSSHMSKLESELLEEKQKSAKLSSQVAKVYFSVRQIKTILNSVTPLFNWIYADAGGSYNVDDGIFYVPVKGLYHFYMGFLVVADPAHTNVVCTLFRKFNGGKRTLGHAQVGTQTSDSYKSASTSVYVELDKGDEFYPRCRNINKVRASWTTIYTGTLIHSY